MSGVSQRCQRSTMIPTFGSPASSRSSSASGIDVISVSESRSEAWIGSSPSRTPASSADGGDPSQAVDHEAPGLLVAALAGRPGQAEDAVRLEGSEAAHRRAERLDPRLDVLRAFDHRVREDRGHERHAVRDAQPACAHRLEVCLVVGDRASSPRCRSRRSRRPRRPGDRRGSSPKTVEISLSESITARPGASRAPAGPPAKRRAREVLRDDVAGARAEARDRVGARPDVPEALDRRRVPGRGGSGAEEKVLVERARPAHRCRRRPSSGSRPRCRPAT